MCLDLNEMKLILDMKMEAAGLHHSFFLLLTDQSCGISYINKSCSFLHWRIKKIYVQQDERHSRWPLCVFFVSNRSLSLELQELFSSLRR